MIYYKEDSSVWLFYPMKVSYSAYGKPEENYTEDVNWWINFVNKWWHHENLSFNPIHPTANQITRLQEINDANIPSIYASTSANYVEFGYVDDKDNPYFSTFSDWVEGVTHVRILRGHEINDLRDQYLYSDVLYNFNGDAAYIQLRDDVDLRNIQVNGTKALAMIAIGQPETIMSYRTKDNIVRNMTAAELFTMINYVGEVGQAVYSASWIHKDRILGNSSYPTEGEYLDTVEKLFNYNIYEGWPGQV